ncbi:MAG: hypothetical protein ABSB94_20450 [Syntrophorhabdales bacterium]
MADEAPNPGWYLRPFVIILLLFFVLGPFGLPLLFKSPRFSKTWKIILTMAVVVYTVYLIFVSLKLGTAVYMEMKRFTAS